MPEPNVGSQDWLYNLYADFWNPEDPSGIQPTAYDFEQGYVLGSPYQMNEPGVGVVEAYMGGNQTWTDPFGVQMSGPNMQQVGDTWQVGTLLNLDDWLAEFDQYIPAFNIQNAQDAYNIGLLEKDKAVKDVLKKGRNSEQYLFDVLYSQDDYDTIYDTALGVGRLSDFKNLANINQMESNYAAEVYNTLGNLGSMGAFTSGELNEGAYQTTVGGGWGDAAVAGNMDFCEQQCEGLAGLAHANCMASCAASGTGGV